MPLVFGILGAIVLGCVIVDKSKEQRRKGANRIRFFGRTNAMAERTFVDYYVKMGYSISEAMHKAGDEMKKRGYDSCLTSACFPFSDKIELGPGERHLCTEGELSRIRDRDSWRVQGRI